MCRYFQFGLPKWAEATMLTPTTISVNCDWSRRAPKSNPIQTVMDLQSSPCSTGQDPLDRLYHQWPTQSHRHIHENTARIYRWRIRAHANGSGYFPQCQELRNPSDLGQTVSPARKATPGLLNVDLAAATDQFKGLCTWALHYSAACCRPEAN